MEKQKLASRTVAGRAKREACRYTSYIPFIRPDRDVSVEPTKEIASAGDRGRESLIVSGLLRPVLHGNTTTWDSYPHSFVGS